VNISDLESAVWNANISRFKREAPIYDQIHPNIFNFIEQQRVQLSLRKASYLTKSKSRIALDFGCGTGNITAKLLYLGWDVVSTDTSEAMLAVLHRKLPEAYDSGRLTLCCLKQKQLPFPAKYFGMITAYSVLHHLYDYMFTVREFSRILDDGGILYIDHEHSEEFWRAQNDRLYKIFMRTSRLSNSIYQRISGLKTVPFTVADYTLTDYRTKERTRVNWRMINSFLNSNGFETQQKTYLTHCSIVPNPIYLACKSHFKNM